MTLVALSVDLAGDFFSFNIIFFFHIDAFDFKFNLFHMASNAT